MRKSFFFLALFLLLLTLSCGGGGSSGGGGSGASNAPAISNLYISPSQVALGQGGGAVSIHTDLDFIDAGGDLSTLTLFHYDKNGSPVLSSPAQLPGESGKTSGHIGGSFIFPTTERGTTTFGIYVTDSGGRESNRLTASFTVY
jgi:hypothetical protein